METTVQVSGQVTAQTRDKIETVKNEVSARIDALDGTLSKDIKPTVDEFKRMKMIGWSVVSIVGLGGTAFGASLIWWGEQMINTARSILRIP